MVINEFGIPKSCFEESYQLLPLSEYSDNVKEVLVENLNDPKLPEVLSVESGNILFTGSGIVPRNILEVPGVKFLHIHPGMLPEIRGADCTLWSNLLKGQPYATLFYMAPGIDDGDIIFGDYLPFSKIQHSAKVLNQKTKYRAIYVFYDPWVRASVLAKGLAITEGLSNISATPQDHTRGVNFHFMHSRLQQAAFEKLFNLVQGI